MRGRKRKEMFGSFSWKLLHFQRRGEKTKLGSKQRTYVIFPYASPTVLFFSFFLQLLSSLTTDKSALLIRLFSSSSVALISRNLIPRPLPLPLCRWRPWLIFLFFTGLGGRNFHPPTKLIYGSFVVPSWRDKHKRGWGRRNTCGVGWRGRSEFELVSTFPFFFL